MTAEEVIRQVQEDAAEWLEMAPDPAMMISGILAAKIVKMQSQIDYLEARLEYVSKSASPF